MAVDIAGNFIDFELININISATTKYVNSQQSIYLPSVAADDTLKCCICFTKMDLNNRNLFVNNDFFSRFFFLFYLFLNLTFVSFTL